MTKATEPVRNDGAAARYFWAAGQPGTAVPTFATRTDECVRPCSSSSGSLPLSFLLAKAALSG
jgi:hypothetical protein